MKKILFFFLLLLVQVTIFSVNTKIDSLQTELEKQNEPISKAALMYDIGFAYLELEDYDSAINYFNMTLELYLELDMKVDLSIVYYSIGEVFSYKNDHRKALEYYNNSLSLDEELEDKVAMAVTYYVIGDSYEMLSEYVKALESYYSGLSLYEEIGDQIGIADSYNVIGNIFQAIEDFDNALEYYEKHLEIKQNVGEKSGISISYNNIGIIYDDKKDFNKALEYYFKALIIDEELNDDKGIATITNNIGIVYLELKEYNKALKYLDQSLLLSIELKDVWAIANTHSNIAEVYIKLHDYSKAFYYVDKSLKLAESIQARDLILETFNIYSTLFSKVNNYKKSLEYYKKYTSLKDTLLTTSIRKIAAYQRNHENEYKEKENELLRKDIQIKDLQIEKQNNLRYSLLAIIFLAICFVMLVYKRYRDKRAEHLLILGKNELITMQKAELDKTLLSLNDLNNNLEKKVNELNLSQERIQILNKILRHDLANDFAVIKSCVRIFRRKTNESILNEIESRTDKSLDTIKRLREQEMFIDSHSNLTEMNLLEVIDVIIKEYKGVDISVEGAGTVFADESLYSVFENLIVNAVNHGESKNIRIDIIDTDTFIQILFKDDGRGIPDEIKDKIFDEGFVHGSKGNTGIGLYIVKQIIEGYGGLISVVDSDLLSSSGAAFKISLRKAIKNKMMNLNSNERL
jgi:tetratricopeptide (TPR) repeat protein/nitrogen-specific signal transduction histidine kinase